MLRQFTATFPRTLTALVATLLLAACSPSSDSVTGPSVGAPAKLDLNTNAVALNGIGAADTIRATVRDAAGNALSAQVTWTSANPAVVEVASSGAIVARAAGTTQLHASAGSLSADVEVRVFGVRGLALTQSALAVRVGDSQSIGAIIDSDPSAQQGLTFTSLNPSVATVSAAGVVNAVAEGTASIKVTSVADSRISATATVTVNPARAVSFAPGGAAVTLWLGDSRTLSASVDVDATDSHDVVWSSENRAVATVTEDGNITATGEGTAIIRATSAADPRAHADLVLTVLPARSVKIAPDSATVALGAQYQLTATVTIESGLNKEVTWSSSDTTVATVDTAGLVSARSTGFATITATSVTDASRSGTAFVTVSNVSAATPTQATRGLSRRKGGR